MKININQSFHVARWLSVFLVNVSRFHLTKISLEVGAVSWTNIGRRLVQIHTANSKVIVLHCFRTILKGVITILFPYYMYFFKCKWKKQSNRCLGTLTQFIYHTIYYKQKINKETFKRSCEYYSLCNRRERISVINIFY